MSFTLEQVAKHNSKESCWIIINNQVYDVTDFLPEHPGGSKIILKYAGKDASEAFDPIHPPGVIDAQLPKEKHLGVVNEKQMKLKKVAQKTMEELRMELEQRNKPPISKMHNVFDLENVARKVLSTKALGYYSSASDDEVTMEENHRAFSRIFFWPRVMRPVSVMDTSTTILGFSSRLPIFVSGAALAKLGHPAGEVNITRACGRAGIIQMVSSNSSCSFAELAEARVHPNQTLFFQLYKNKNDETAQLRVEHVDRLGFKAIFLTVDAVVMSNRERDIKTNIVREEADSQIQQEPSPTEKVLEAGDDDEEKFDVRGTAGELIANDDRDMTWEKTIPWLRGVTKLPIVIKGIQCVEDAVLAVEAGVDGIMISNHGGISMPSVDVLYRLRRERPDVFDKVEVYIDGGIRRGTDVLKCLCLGARAVGLGRPALYAQSAYGEAGVTRLIQILDRELRIGMSLLGAANISALTPNLVEQVQFQPAQMRAKL
ncbi:FMN-dependent dehydrogenase-domain-containing protein [Hysterangium stoloniferum]|nr:FMN-dependent dehydrogenase-domain-containing protein [Hysterangium stoloniferum]